MPSKPTGADRSSFQYVYAWSGNSGKWETKLPEEIPAYVVKHNSYDVYHTILRYEKTHDKAKDTDVKYGPLYFDMDSKLTLLQLIDQGHVEDVEEVKPYVSGEIYDVLKRRQLGQPVGDVELEAYLADENLTPEANMFRLKKNADIARRDALEIIDFFKKFGLTDDEVRVWFSGQKGFHIIVNEEIVGVEPSEDMQKHFKHIALYLVELLNLRTLDPGVYSWKRQLRIPDTVHAKTKLYKTELTHEELAGDIESIMTAATAPRGPVWNEADLEFTKNEILYTWYTEQVEDWKAIDRTISTKVSDKTLASLVEMDGYPVCVKFIMENGGDVMRHSGTNRNRITMQLGTYFKDAGYTFEEAVDAIYEWSLKLPRDVSTSSAQEKKANTRSCLRTVYDNPNYHFTCAGIRSIGKKSQRDKTIVPCSGRSCPVDEAHDIDQQESIKVHLSAADKADYAKQKISFDCLVSGKLDTAYQVPKKVEYECRAMDLEKMLCQGCVMAQKEGFFEKEFHENDRFLIEATNQPDNNLKGILRTHSGASCNKVSCRVLEYVNVSEVLVVPMAERVTSIKVNDDNTTTSLEKPVDETGNEYVARKVYAVGSDIQTNSYYELTGYAYPHPKNQLGTVLSQQQIPKQDTVGGFKVTDELIDAFKVFQVQEGETIDDRLDLLISDIEGNVTKVRRREAVHLAVLMTYHSCMRYYFMSDELEARGWMELCLVGDSGQAKTLLVSRIQEFCGLGELIGGETAGRTGLLYNLQQLGERWFVTFGAYPLNDRKLLAIDEFSGLGESEFEQMTEARETGVLRVTRIVKTETNARTRLIFMSNPRFGKQLAEFSYGVESLKQLFREAADIRRLDLAVFLKSGDVPQQIMNQEYDRPAMQLVQSEVMKASVLWAWSRSENQIVIDKATRDVIFKAANDLGDKYGAAVDIPLLEPATLRKKLARMSIALAALLHSTDETHEKIIVKPEHVKYVRVFLDTMYSYKNCRLDIYAQKAKNESVLTEAEADELMVAFNTGDFVENAYATRDILDLFRKNDVLKAAEIADLTGLEKATINARLNLLQRHLMIKRTRDGMRKTPKGIEFLEIYFNEE